MKPGQEWRGCLLPTSRVCVCVYVYFCARFLWLKSPSKEGQEGDKWCNPQKRRRGRGIGRKEGRRGRRNCCFWGSGAPGMRWRSCPAQWDGETGVFWETLWKLRTCFWVMWFGNSCHFFIKWSRKISQIAAWPITEWQFSLLLFFHINPRAYFLGQCHIVIHVAS